MTSDIIFQTQSALIVMLLLYGFTQRKNRYRHVKMMKFAIIWDLLLVAQIELTRGAIMKASKVMVNPAILNIHVLLAVSTVILYFVIFYTGHKLLNGHRQYRKIHLPLGLITLTTRISTFITSFLIST